MKDITIFIDESGTLPDKKDKVIIVAAVGTSSSEKIETIIKTVKKRGKFRKATGELKFYTAGEKSKALFFEKLVKEDFDIFILTVGKMGRKIPDTPLHFAILSGLLLEDVFAFYPFIYEIIFDRHFHKNKDIEKFNKALKDFLGRDLPKISHVESAKNKKVNVADMVAGAVLAKETGKDSRYYQIIKERIISEIRLNWPEAKRKLFRKKEKAFYSVKKLARTGAGTHPRQE